MTTCIKCGQPIPDVELFCEDLRNYAAGRKLKRLVDRAVGY